MRSLRLTALVIGLTGLLIGAGCTTDTRFSQAQLDALQMREFDVPQERAYLGVVGAMIEERFWIRESNMESGLLVASRLLGDAWGGYQQNAIQITVQSTGGAGSSVRISTSSNGQTRVDEALIKRLHERIDVHVHTPVTDIAWGTTP